MNRFRSIHLPVHTFVLVVTYILNTVLATSVSVEIVLRPLAIAIVATAVVLAALCILFRSVEKAAVIATVLVAVLASVDLWRFPIAVITRTEAWQAIVWSILAGVTAIVGFRVVRGMLRTTTWSSASRSLNLFTALLLLVVVLTGSFSGTLGQLIVDSGRLLRPSAVMAKADGPDVILLLLDGYPRADILDEIFDFDNQPFLKNIADLGFDVSEKSRSNYTFTHLTLSSMLNMRFMDELAPYREVAAGHASESLVIRSLIDGSAVLKRFHEQGYSIVTVPPDIDWVTLHTADTVVQLDQINEFEYHLMRSTGIGQLISLIQPTFLTAQHGGRVLDALNDLASIATTDAGGRFIFAHIVSPHAPVSFTSSGAIRTPPNNDDIYLDWRAQTDLSADEWIGPYREQLSFLNARVADALHTIIEGNPSAVVILMSDHGSGAYWDPSSADWSDERLSNLFAARTPGRANPFSEHQTPVNVFPSLFNAYFGDDIPLHKDSTFLSVFDFVEVPNPDAPE